jgi:hypothetical protein
LYFWGIYEMGFSEDAHTIGSKGFLNYLWGLSEGDPEKTKYGGAK